MGVVVRRYIDVLILFRPPPLVLVLFCSSIPTSLFIFKMFFRSLYIYVLIVYLHTNFIKKIFCICKNEL